MEWHISNPKMYFNRLKAGRKRDIKKKNKRGSGERHFCCHGGGVVVHCSEGCRAVLSRPSAGGKLAWGCEEGAVMGSGLLTRKEERS